MTENIKKAVVGVLFSVLAIIIIFNFLGTGSSTELVEASDSITNANNCSGTDASGGALYFNASTNGCHNTSGNNTYTVTFQRLPLSNLFGTNSVAILALMAGILLGLIAYVIKKVKTGE